MSKLLAHIDNSMHRVTDAIGTVTPGPDVDRCLLEQVKEKLSGLKLELFDVSRSILALSDDTTVQAEQSPRFRKAYLMHALALEDC